jgi:hypothetical protein
MHWLSEHPAACTNALWTAARRPATADIVVAAILGEFAGVSACDLPLNFGQKSKKLLPMRTI